MPASAPRQHHYISKLLLKYFADPVTPDGTLYCFDHSARRMWRSTPRKSARERDYNALDPTIDSNVDLWETAQSEFESNAAISLQIVHGPHPHLNEQQWARLLLFAACLFLNVPRARRVMEGIHLQRVEETIRAFGRNKASLRRWRQSWTRLRSNCSDDPAKQSGLDAFALMTPEAFLADMKSGRFTIRTDNRWKLWVVTQLMGPMTTLLLKRHWHVLAVPTELDPLIIGDAPIALVPLTSNPLQPMGVRRADTAVYFPIGPRLFLFGLANETQSLRKIDSGLVERLNLIQLAWSLNRVFGSTADFAVSDSLCSRRTWSGMVADGQFPPFVQDSGDIVEEYTMTSARKRT